MSYPPHPADAAAKAQTEKWLPRLQSAYARGADAVEAEYRACSEEAATAPTAAKEWLDRFWSENKLRLLYQVAKLIQDVCGEFPEFLCKFAKEDSDTNRRIQTKDYVQICGAQAADNPDFRRKLQPFEIEKLKYDLDLVTGAPARQKVLQEDVSDRRRQAIAHVDVQTAAIARKQLLPKRHALETQQLQQIGEQGEVTKASDALDAVKNPARISSAGGHIAILQQASPGKEVEKLDETVQDRMFDEHVAQLQTDKDEKAFAGAMTIGNAADDAPHMVALSETLECCYSMDATLKVHLAGIMRCRQSAEETERQLKDMPGELDAWLMRHNEQSEKCEVEHKASVNDRDLGRDRLQRLLFQVMEEARKQQQREVVVPASQAKLDQRAAAAAAVTQLREDIKGLMPAALTACTTTQTQCRDVSREVTQKTEERVTQGKKEASALAQQGLEGCACKSTLLDAVHQEKKDMRGRKEKAKEHEEGVISQLSNLGELESDDPRFKQLHKAVGRRNKIEADLVKIDADIAKAQDGKQQAVMDMQKYSEMSEADIKKVLEGKATEDMQKYSEMTLRLNEAKAWENARQHIKKAFPYVQLAPKVYGGGSATSTSSGGESGDPVPAGAGGKGVTSLVPTEQISQYKEDMEKKMKELQLKCWEYEKEQAASAEKMERMEVIVQTLMAERDERLERGSTGSLPGWTKIEERTS